MLAVETIMSTLPASSRRLARSGTVNRTRLVRFSCSACALATSMPDSVADSDAEVLESLLANVMRQVTMQLDAPVSGLAGTPLSSAEGSLLVELLAAGEATQQQIASRLQVDKSRVSRLCTALERKGLLARERDQSNRRNLRVQVTEPGEKAATRLRQAWRAQHEQMLAAMTPRERRALLVGLAAFARQLSALHPAGEPGREPQRRP
jgi:DNA-binding MarR family transcriptional regulator